MHRFVNILISGFFIQEWIKITDHTLLQLAKSIDVMVTYFNEYRRKFNEKSSAASGKETSIYQIYLFTLDGRLWCKVYLIAKLDN